MNQFNLEKFEKETKNLFNSLSQFYDSWFIRWLYNEWLYRKIIKIIEQKALEFLNNGCKFLDIVCGTGEIILRLASKYPKTEFGGIDFSEEMVKRAINKTFHLSNVRIINANARELPFQEDMFDIIVLIDTFHHLANPQKVLSEIYRVSKRGGLLFLVDLAANNFLTKHIFNIFVKPFDKPKNYYSKKELITIVEGTGFEIKELFTYLLNNFLFAIKI